AGLAAYSASFDEITCLCMQGGQGESKHWACNDPPQRVAPYDKPPPSVAEYRKQGARVVELHPMTMMQNARIWRDLACPLTRRNCGTIGNLEIRNGQYLAPRLA
ncbi:MAG: hypothetical protein PHR10_11080, partial [Sphaerochaetaceae bacterium]|nr:hypothetical protein [Sphaerochaetaceae bacterium]